MKSKQKIRVIEFVKRRPGPADPDPIKDVMVFGPHVVVCRREVGCR
jgi:hypothetical protein